MSAYADASFLVSLYVLDANSVQAAARMKRAQLPLLITPFVELELTNAISLRLFRKELPASTIKAAIALLDGDLQGGVLLSRPIPASAFERAKRMAIKQTPRLGTRSLDVLHVASALALKTDTLYTFDARQAKRAAAEGLHII